MSFSLPGQHPARSDSQHHPAEGDLGPWPDRQAIGCLGGADRVAHYLSNMRRTSVDGSHRFDSGFDAFLAGLGCRRVRAIPARTRATPASMLAVMVSLRTRTPSTIATTGSR